MNFEEWRESSVYKTLGLPEQTGVTVGSYLLDNHSAISAARLAWEAATLAEREANAAQLAILHAALDELIAALKPILTISDRKHNAWDHAYEVIAKIEKE